MLLWGIAVLSLIALSWSFQHGRPSILKSSRMGLAVAKRRESKQSSTSKLHMHSSPLDGASTALIAAGVDYASEIENAVGEEIYGPIFQAGIFLFVSGIVAAFGVAFIVSKSDAWDDLEEEFDAGKQKQLIVSDAEEAVRTSTSPVERIQETASPPSSTSPVENGDSSGVGDLDL